MRLEHLRSLIEISKNPSMSAAAHKLHLTPQGLSISISKMEKELGFQLLERTFKGTTLTNDGKKLVAISIVLFDVIEEIRKSHQQSVPQLAGDYNLPLLYGNINCFLISAFTEITQRFPPLKLNTYSLTATEIFQAVAKGDAECGLIFQYEIDGQLRNPLPNDFTFHPLCPCQLMASIPQTLAISDCHVLSFKKLSAYTFILHCREDDPCNLYMDILNHSFPDGPPPIIRQDILPMCESMAISNRYVSLFLQPATIKTFPKTFPAMNYIPIKDNISITYGYITCRDHVLSPEGDAIIRILHETLSNTN